MEKKFQEFLKWLEEHHPDLEYTESDIKAAMAAHPKASFKKLVKELSNTKQTPKTNNEETTMSEVNNEVVQEEEVQVTEATETGIKVTVVPRTKCDDIVDSMSQWADQNPKTAVAVTAGAGLLAAYGAYKLVSEFL